MLPAPMLASPADLTDVGVYIVDPNWVLEQKLDGHRVRWDLATGEFTNRNGERYTKKVPASLREFPKLEGGYVLDGELVGDKFYVFDVLQDGSNMHVFKLSERREILVPLIEVLQNLMMVTRGYLLEEQRNLLPLQIVPQAQTQDEKKALVARVIQENLEGVVAKSLNSIYKEGRSIWWIKVKVTPTADVVVMDVRDDGKESARLGIMRNGKLVEVGRCSLIGKPPVNVGDVIEVKYLYVTEDLRLYQPTLMRVRFDKTSSDCNGADFRVVNKSVIQHL